MLKKAVSHFFNFHKGAVNIALHVVGFLLLIYSLVVSNRLLFGTSLIVIELGHVYNHYMGIEAYDTRPKIIFWRVSIFCALVVLFYYFIR